MSSQLYQDLQWTIQDAYIVAIRMKLDEKESNLERKVFLYQLGTDQLESLFSTVRTLTHASRCDFIELIERLQISDQIEKVFEEHPLWRKKSRLCSSFTNDYSSGSSWIGNLSTS